MDKKRDLEIRLLELLLEKGEISAAGWHRLEHLKAEECCEGMPEKFIARMKYPVKEA